MAILAAFDIFILKSLSQAPLKKKGNQREIIAAERGSHQFVTQRSYITRSKQAR
jgi:hypothetical protein